MKASKIEWAVEVTNGKNVEFIQKNTREEARKVKNRAKRNGKQAKIFRNEYRLKYSEVIR